MLPNTLSQRELKSPSSTHSASRQRPHQRHKAPSPSACSQSATPILSPGLCVSLVSSTCPLSLPPCPRGPCLGGGGRAGSKGTVGILAKTPPPKLRPFRHPGNGLKSQTDEQSGKQMPTTVAQHMPPAFPPPPTMHHPKFSSMSHQGCPHSPPPPKL